MLKRFRYFLAIPVIAVLLISPVYANNHVPRTGDETTKECGTPGRPPCPKPAATVSTGNSDFKLNIQLNNPLKVDTIEGAIQKFMSALVRVAIPFIIVFFIWSGFNFILARGNPEGLKKAKNMFWYTIIGALLILGAWTITNAIIGTVNSISS